MDQQSSANEVAAIDTAMATLGKAPVDFFITPQMEAWIDYNALSGIVTDNMEEGNGGGMRKMSISEFAQIVGVHRDTLRNWRTYIPNFWDRVNERRRELAPHARLQLVHQRWYIKAVAMDDWRITEAWLRNHDPDYKESKQKVEHELGNTWAALLRGKQDVLEGEIVDEPTDQPG